MTSLTHNIYEGSNISNELITHLNSNELYEKSYESSHFRTLYNSFICEAENLNKEQYSIITIEQNNKIIGLSILEWLEEPQKIQGTLLKNQFYPESKPKLHLNKHFNLSAWFQIYVSPEYRNQGIAGQTAQFVEQFYLNHKKLNLQEHEIPLIVAKGRAEDIAKHNMQHTNILPTHPPYHNLSLDIHRLTFNYMMDIYDGKKTEFLNDSLKDIQIFPVKEKTKKRTI